MAPRCFRRGRVGSRWFPAIVALALISTVAPAQDEKGAPAKPKDEKVYMLGPGIRPPKKIAGPEPEPPKQPHKGRYKGEMIVELIVGTDGQPREVKISRHLQDQEGSATAKLRDEFEKNAVEAVSKWKFKPGEKDSQPVATRIQVEVSYSLW